MIKRYCDWCQDEITEANQPTGGCVTTGNAGNRLGVQVKRKGHTLSVEIMHAFDDTWNSGDICKYCLIGVINTLDDRPKIECAS